MEKTASSAISTGKGRDAIEFYTRQKSSSRTPGPKNTAENSEPLPCGSSVSLVVKVFDFWLTCKKGMNMTHDRRKPHQ